MPGCPIEKAQDGVLMRIAENGNGAVKILSNVYSTDEVARAAM